MSADESLQKLPIASEKQILSDWSERPGILRQQMGRWHRRQNNFAKVWEQTKVTARLNDGYFHEHSSTHLNHLFL